VTLVFTLSLHCSMPLITSSQLIPSFSMEGWIWTHAIIILTIYIYYCNFSQNSETGSESESCDSGCKFDIVARKSDIEHKFIALQMPVHLWDVIKSLRPLEPWSPRPDLLCEYGAEDIRSFRCRCENLRQSYSPIRCMSHRIEKGQG
jgi:hypothetical protein